MLIMLDVQGRVLGGAEMHAQGDETDDGRQNHHEEGL